MTRLVTDHRDSVGGTHVQHLWFAVRFGTAMILGGLACCLHGVLPFLCMSSGNRTVLALHGRIRSRGRGVPHSTSQHAAAVPPATAEYVI